MGNDEDSAQRTGKAHSSKQFMMALFSSLILFALLILFSQMESLEGKSLMFKDSKTDHFSQRKLRAVSHKDKPTTQQENEKNAKKDAQFESRVTIHNSSQQSLPRDEKTVAEHQQKNVKIQRQQQSEINANFVKEERINYKAIVLQLLKENLNLQAKLNETLHLLKQCAVDGRYNKSKKAERTETPVRAATNNVTQPDRSQTEEQNQPKRDGFNESKIDSKDEVTRKSSPDKYSKLRLKKTDKEILATGKNDTVLKDAPKSRNQAVYSSTEPAIQSKNVTVFQMETKNAMERSVKSKNANISLNTTSAPNQKHDKASKQKMLKV
ncbi:unnamed protein product [Clavelina lepadiformis]|uniref:Uncharacterized protein n=1 Tax=Clavelina lepadiformis TaxID=159417 RepID=A0ABP0GSY9_CLALP